MPVIQDGNYRGRAVGPGVLMESKEKKTPSVLVKCQLLDYPETFLYWNGWLTDAAQERTIESLRHCGWRGTDITDITFPEDNEVILVVKTEEYEGKRHSKVAFINGTRAKVESNMDPASAKAFSERMRGALLAYDAKNPQPPTDDIPF